MTNHNIADFHWNGQQWNLGSFYSSHRDLSRQPVTARCDFDRPVFQSDTSKGEAQNENVRRQENVGDFGEERPPIVYVSKLILGTTDGCITAPLVSDDAVIHRGAHDA